MAPVPNEEMVERPEGLAEEQEKANGAQIPEGLETAPIPGFKEVDQSCGNCRHLVSVGDGQAMGAGQGTCAKYVLVNPLLDVEANWCVGYEKQSGA